MIWIWRSNGRTPLGEDCRRLGRVPRKVVRTARNLASVALWFIPTWTFVYGFDSLSLSMTVLLSMFLGAANTYAVYVRHDQRVGPMPDRI